MLIKLSVGITYHFTVDPPFDMVTGVYTVNGILSYTEAVDQGIDISEIYDKYGVSLSVFHADLNTIRNGSILKLINPDFPNETPIYLPSIYVTIVPDHNVKKYRELVFAINLGTMDDNILLDSIGTNISEYLKSAIGVDTPPQLFELKSIWMTEEEYSILESERQSKASTVVNYFSECIRLRNEVDQLRNKLSAYEETFLRLAGS